jgi:exonuclease SbcD
VKVAQSSAGYRVLHTADWHLGKLLGDLSREEEHARFLAFLLETIAAEKVDLLIVAGDIFDSANPPQSALRQYYEFLSKLYAAGGCAVVIVAGNHDSPMQLESPREVLKTLGATVVGAVQDDPVILLPDEESPRLAVAAIPFLRDRDLRSGQMGQGEDAIRKALVAGIAKRYSDAGETVGKLPVPALAIGHLTVAGASTAESEREIHIGGLGSVTTEIFPQSFDYVALGHLHRPQSCEDDDRVRYSGSPIPLSFSEAEDNKEVRLLEFDGDGLASQRGVAIPLARRLVQVRTRRAGLELELAGLTAEVGELPTWVEVLVEDSISGENVLEQVRELTAEQDYEVVRVVCERLLAVDGARVVEGADGSEEDLLGDPIKVFELRLEREIGLEDEERAALELAFREVFECMEQEEAE